MLTPENDTLVEITELITVIGQPDGTGGAEPAAVAGMVEPAAAALQQEIAVLATASAAGMEFDPAAPARESLATRAEEAGVLAALVELEDDDAARITLTVDPEEVTEDGGPRQVQVTATLAGAAFSIDRVVSVSVGADGDSAEVGVDYEPVESFRITIPKGTNAGVAPFTLVPMDDRELEEDERITVGGVLWGSDNPVPPATVTLLDDDKRAARERIERVTDAILPEFTRAWTESVLGAARGCVAPRAGDAGGLTEVAAALHGSAAAVNAGEMALAEALADAGVAMPVVRGGTAAGGEHDPAAVDRITLWGEGDYHALGRADGTVRWDGELMGAHLGVDARLDDHYVAGAGLSLTQGEAEYADYGGDEPVRGTYRSRLTSLHPYLCWNGEDGSNAWATVGFGVGRVEVDDELAGRHDSPATAATVGLGGSLRLLGGERLAHGGAAALNLRSDAWLTRHEVSGAGLIGATEVITHRARVALHGSKVFALGGEATLTPEAELGVRWDGGPGLSGAGMELGGALTFNDPAWRLAAEVRGRALMMHEQAVRDWGVSGRLRLGPGDSGEGVTIDVQPSYGSADSGSERLWTQGVAGAPATADETPAARLSTEVGYGLAAAGGAALLTPYGGLDWAAGTRSYRVGGRLAVGGRFDLELEGRRIETDDRAAAHEVALRGATSW